MADVEGPSDLGPWTDANFLVTAKAAVGIGSDDGVPPQIRFFSNIAKLVRRRLAIQPSEIDLKKPGIFLFQPLPPQAVADKNPKRIPMLDNGLEPLTGRVWFVGANPASGHYVIQNASDDDELFAWVANELGEGGTPAIIFDPRVPTTELRYYPKGLSDPTTCEILSFSEPTVTLDEVVAAVEATYKKDMITPEAQPKAGKLWQNHDKWWPSRQAEDIVQLYLQIGLHSAFPTCVVRHEQTMPEGRLDLEIETNDPVEPSKITRHAILELKVLRSYGETGIPVAEGYTLEWIKSRVQQAASYRDSKGAKWGALFCFDMRKADMGDEDCFAHVRALAKKLSVHVRRWYLYSKSSHLRAAQAASKL